MTLLKKFSDTGQEIGSEEVDLNKLDFQAYIDQYGIERAKGYCDALSDLFYDLYGEQPVPFTVHRMSTQAVKFLNRNEILLKRFQEILKNNQYETKPESDQKYIP